MSLHQEESQWIVRNARNQSLLTPDVAMTNVICLSGDATLNEAAKLMRTEHIGDVLVVEEREGKRFPIGIVTDRDIAIETFGQDVRGDDLLVEDIMSTEMVTASLTDDVFSIIRLMKANGVGRVPIVEEDGALVGIVTGKKLFQTLLEGLHDLAEISDQQQRNEQILRH